MALDNLRDFLGAIEARGELARVTHPVAVRYGWASFTDANLYNSAGLPASTFTAEAP